MEFPPQIQPKQRATRSHHAKSLIQLSCRTNLYQNSFFSKTIRDWNALPETEVMASSVEAFTAVLKDYTADSEHLLIFNINYFFIFLLYIYIFYHYLHQHINACNIRLYYTLHIPQRLHYIHSDGVSPLWITSLNLQ